MIRFGGVAALVVVFVGVVGGSAPEPITQARCPPPGATSGHPIVAVVDSGVASLPGLQEAVDVAGSRNFVAGDDSAGLLDRNGHGTAMAAIVSSTAE